MSSLLPRTMREIHAASTERTARKIRPGENWQDYLRRREAEAFARAYGDIAGLAKAICATLAQPKEGGSR